MILKNAGLKSKEEAMHRMIDGEVFYSQTITFSCSKNTNTTSDLRARFLVTFSDGGSDDINSLWSDIEEWQTEIKWQDTLEDGPVLCWVSDISLETRCCAVLIALDCSDEGGVYKDVGGIHWEYATPVSPNECLGE